MRIITGLARGCRLKTPQGAATTRPTADRVKESLFNILGDMVRGRTVLDLFAGTGNLGLEALSRGAAAATFVDRATGSLIAENAQRTRLAAQSTICAGDAWQVLGRLQAQGQRFSLIFCDPPYHLGLWQRALAVLDGSTLLTPDGILVVEHGADEDALPAIVRLERRDHRRYGHTTQLSYFQWRDYGAAEEAEP